jgi:hypothetical protein
VSRRGFLRGARDQSAPPAAALFAACGGIGSVDLPPVATGCNHRARTKAPQIVIPSDEPPRVVDASRAAALVAHSNGCNHAARRSPPLRWQRGRPSNAPRSVATSAVTRSAESTIHRRTREPRLREVAPPRSQSTWGRPGAGLRPPRRPPLVLPPPSERRQPARLIDGERRRDEQQCERQDGMEEG